MNGPTWLIVAILGGIWLGLVLAALALVRVGARADEQAAIDREFAEIVEQLR